MISAPEYHIETVVVNGPLKGVQARSRHNWFKTVVPPKVDTIEEPVNSASPQWPEELTYQLYQVWEDRLDVDILPYVRETIREKAFKTQDGCYYYWAVDLSV